MGHEPTVDIGAYDIADWQMLARQANAKDLVKLKQVPRAPEIPIESDTAESDIDSATARLVSEKLFIGADSRIIAGAGRAALRGGQTFARETEEFIRTGLA